MNSPQSKAQVAIKDALRKREKRDVPTVILLSKKEQLSQEEEELCVLLDLRRKIIEPLSGFE